MLKNRHSKNRISGKYVTLREANVEDAEFIFRLRSDPKKQQYISHTSGDMYAQKVYMHNYKTLEDEWYFIIEDKSGSLLGTISAYPYPAFCPRWAKKEIGTPARLDNVKGIMGTGRWLMIDNKNPMLAIESDSLIKKFLFEHLHDSFNCSIAPMIIHKNNTSVIKYQMKWGASTVGWIESLQHHMLELTREDYFKNKVYFEGIIYGKNNRQTISFDEF